LEQWNAFVELLPLWLAPNMVTLLGFMCIIFNVGLLIVMMPDLEGPVRAFRATLPPPS
jgi:ethanolaminephosphotransferase